MLTHGTVRVFASPIVSTFFGLCRATAPDDDFPFEPVELRWPSVMKSLDLPEMCGKDANIWFVRENSGIDNSVTACRFCQSLHPGRGGASERGLL
jgi:hypothetical protein